MTRGFWQDPQRYEMTYWSRWPDTWVHGDFAAIDEDGMWYILGRSDDTIKVAGKRVGPAEIESILVGHPNVIEAAAIGVPHPIKGSQVVVFCVLKERCLECADLRAPSCERGWRTGPGQAAAPQDILFVSDLPKTRNAKVMRRMIRSAYMGQEAGDTSSLVNPEPRRRSADSNRFELGSGQAPGLVSQCQGRPTGDGRLQRPVERIHSAGSDRRGARGLLATGAGSISRLWRLRGADGPHDTGDRLGVRVRST
jgi:hypothetical protein